WGNITVALVGWCPLSPTGAQTTQLLVEPPWRPAVLWDQVTLTCKGSGTAGATTWYKDGQRWGQKGLNHFTVKESGAYTCDRPGTGRSPPVRVLQDPLVLQVQAQPLLEGDTLTLRSRFWRDMFVTSVRFYHGDEEVNTPLLHHSGQYHCRGLVYSEVSRSWVQQYSALVTVTVHGEPHPHSLPEPPGLGHSAPSGDPHPVSVPTVPVANGTITPGPLSHQVHTGDPVTLRCSVQVGSAPVTFTWLQNGQEVAQGPVLELGDVDVGHSGTYQCVATNQLGQDGHRMFQALSPELALEVTSWGHGGKGGVSKGNWLAQERDS
uniref:Ig-like domain-containing protein n=1 Tax=Zosterops lateralis melanops TaxID=1220523 RepID=A0A8D2PR71_ZOSLA